MGGAKAPVCNLSLLLEVFYTPSLDSICPTSSVNDGATSWLDSIITASISAYHRRSYVEAYRRVIQTQKANGAEPHAPPYLKPSRREYTAVSPDCSFALPLRDRLTQHPVAQVPTLHLVSLFHPYPAYNHRGTIGRSGRYTVALAIIHYTGHLAGLAWGGSLPWCLRGRLLFEFGWGGGTGRGIWCLSNGQCGEKAEERHNRSDSFADCSHPGAPSWIEWHCP